ncbi:MAG: HAD family hydrolase [Chloroflexia bacterium]|nr:HAD family hydrolase [Chloroflexia bacterium]
MTGLFGNRPVRLVTFDLYDTLVEAVPPRWERFTAAAAKGGIAADPSIFLAADLAAEEFYTIENGKNPIRDRSPSEQEQFRIDYSARMLEAAGLPCDPATARRIRDIYRGELDAIGWNYRAFDDVLPALETLERHGIGRAVISNADADITAFCLHMGFAKHMDLIVTSALVGWEKPDSRTFFAALDPLEIAPGDAIHVGDQALSDVVGARRVGMAAALIDRYDRHHGGEYESIRVRSLTDLADAVVEHNRQFLMASDGS